MGFRPPKWEGGTTYSDEISDIGVSFPHCHLPYLEPCLSRLAMAPPALNRVSRTLRLRAGTRRWERKGGTEGGRALLLTLVRPHHHHRRQRRKQQTCASCRRHSFNFIATVRPPATTWEVQYGPLKICLLIKRRQIGFLSQIGHQKAT